MAPHTALRSTRLAAAVLAASAGAALAQPSTLRPGLWEMAQQAQDPQQQAALEQSRKAMAAMPPQQRKAVEDMMAKQGIALQPNGAVRMCVTRELLASPDWMHRRDAASGCSTDMQPAQGGTQTFKFSCSQSKSSGEGSVTYQGDTAYTSRVVTRVQGQPPVTVSSSGRWVQADCGGIQPIRPPKS